MKVNNLKRSKRLFTRFVRFECFGKYKKKAGKEALEEASKIFYAGCSSIRYDPQRETLVFQLIHEKV